MKKLLSIVLCLVILIVPFSGSFTFTLAASTTLPLISINIEPYAAISPDTVITVSYTAQGSNTLSSCDTRLEGTSLSTETSFSFTPAGQGLSDGLYTLMMEATDSAGNTSFEPLTFLVSSDVEVAYTLENGVVSSSSAVTVYAADALDFSAAYGSDDAGVVDLSTLNAYNAEETYNLRYTDNGVSASSVSGIPYQVFDIDLAGKTTGEVAVSYSGATKAGERMAVKVFNPATSDWDTVGTFMGTGSVSELVDIATYNTSGKIYVAAVLDYVTNGSDSFIWTTDPQHYTKFADLNEYYYKIYQYAADLYVAGEVGYIINSGDLVDDLPTTSVSTKQWQIADKAMSIAEGVNMPYGLVAGNHDVNTFSSPDYSTDNPVNYTKFAQTFPADRYNNQAWYGGSLNNNTSHYDLITMGNIDFIILYLGYGLEATDETIAWANDVLETYSHRTAIIVTHQYLDATTAVRSSKSRAELIYSTIVDPNPNVKMVLCGHDDGSLMLEKTASDGRTYYEILSDYQFVEAEDPSFYANEHYIGSVPHCCGDGYLRIMTIEGDSLSSITYSPVTDRYNPYGDRESFTIDLNTGAADREFVTTGFSAAILGDVTTAANVDRVAAVTADSNTSYTGVIYASVPDSPAEQTGGAAATPSNPYYTHSASQAPIVASKVDLLRSIGLNDNTVINQYTYYGNYSSNPLHLSIDLSQTPYLYYSVSQPTDSNFTFAFINNNTAAPWLVFRDASGSGAYLNQGADNWDSFDNRQQYTTTSETGCIDMRTLLKDAANTTWTINQVTFYNSKLKDVVINYMFFGSAPLDTSAASNMNIEFGQAATPLQPYFAHAAISGPEVETKVDMLSIAGFSAYPSITTSAFYATDQTVDLNKTPYLYYSFAQTDGSKFTFAFQNNLSTIPWLTYLDFTNGTPIMNYGVSRFESAGSSKYATTGATGCIDMRKLLTNPTDTAITVQQLRLYVSGTPNVAINYLYFGSAPIADPDGSAPIDLNALRQLIARAKAIDTTLYLTAGVTELTAALAQANDALSADHPGVSKAYVRLADAIGALTLIPDTIDESTLTSVHKYSMTLSDWTANSVLNTTQYSNGFYLEIPSTASSAWAALTSKDSYTVKPERGQLYLKVDVDANSGWAFQMNITQNGVTDMVHMNGGIENAFSSPGVDGWEGVFQGIYDVSDAFEMNGFDPASTFTVNYVYFYVVGVGGSVTVNHLQLFTNADDGVTDSSILQAAITRAGRYTQSMYTSASWSTMQSALTGAKSALSDTGLEESDLNLKALALNNAIDALVLADSSVAETAGSLLPADTGLWAASVSGEITATRSNGATVIQNTTGYWPSVTYTLDDPMRVFVQDSRLVVDMTVGDRSSILLYLGDEEWLKVNEYIGDVNSAKDITAGTYQVSIPLSEIAEIADRTSITIYKVRIFSVGVAASSAVTMNTLRIADYDSFDWSEVTSSAYGVAATPSNPYYAHCAPFAPEVDNKVDVLTVAGLDDHPVVTQRQSYGSMSLNLRVDLSVTPYLYYSFAQSESSTFTFSFHNNAGTAPYLTFLDDSAGDAVMGTSSDVWNSYTAGEQYVSGSETGCIDMRALLKDPSNTTWTINNLTFYNPKGEDVTISYLFFGSEPTYVEENVDVEVNIGLVGDINDDGAVTTSDARLCLMEILRFTPTFTAIQKARADINGDGVINTTDVRKLLRTSIS